MIDYWSNVHPRLHFCSPPLHRRRWTRQGSSNQHAALMGRIEQRKVAVIVVVIVAVVVGPSYRYYFDGTAED